MRARNAPSSSKILAITAEIALRKASSGSLSASRSDRRQSFNQSVYRVDSDLGEDFLLAAEVVIDVPLGQSALARDLVHVGGVVTAMREGARRAHQDFPAALLGLGDIADAVAADAERPRLSRRARFEF